MCNIILIYIRENQRRVATGWPFVFLNPSIIGKHNKFRRVPSKLYRHSIWRLIAILYCTCIVGVARNSRGEGVGASAIKHTGRRDAVRDELCPRPRDSNQCVRAWVTINCSYVSYEDDQVLHLQVYRRRKRRCQHRVLGGHRGPHQAWGESTSDSLGAQVTTKITMTSQHICWRQKKCLNYIKQVPY